ncbi:MAG: phospholipid-binding protein MlaC [Paracoccus sp. (in: a-proteobacteria)]|uniref:MlaC/ttg2D family ABC transporter substrate-binding protein n=1 Tax=Paracoccus sp. TaxID=267 RepID=UPI00391BE6FA
MPSTPTTTSPARTGRFAATTRYDRRGVLGLLACAGLVAILPAAPAFAAGVDAARAHIQRAVDEVYDVINTGHPPAQIFREFEEVFARYADVDVMARSVLGPVARQTPAAELAAYQQAFQGYVGRKYGKRFREFVGSRVEVTGAQPLKSFVAVTSVAHLRGRAPMQVEWHVSDRSGDVRFFNLIIEGVNMLASERAEMASMLALRQGSVAALTADLQQAG